MPQTNGNKQTIATKKLVAAVLTNSTLPGQVEGLLKDFLGAYAMLAPKKMAGRTKITKDEDGKDVPVAVTQNYITLLDKEDNTQRVILRMTNSVRDAFEADELSIEEIPSLQVISQDYEGSVRYMVAFPGGDAVILDGEALAKAAVETKSKTNVVDEGWLKYAL